MPNRELLDRANAILDRVFMLDDGVANAWAFRALLEKLHASDLSLVKEPHVSAVAMVRAGILRAAISSTMALLDREDRRDNRASIGQVLAALDDAAIGAVLVEGRTVARLELKQQYAALIAGDLYSRGVRLRNDAVAHLLDQDTPTPTVQYGDIFLLHDAAAAFVVSLHAICGRSAPRFLDTKTRAEKSAAVFWQTYFVGMNSMAENNIN